MARQDPTDDPNGSTRIGGDARPSGTHTGADVTGRTTGTPTDRPHVPEHTRTTDTHVDRDMTPDDDRRDYGRVDTGRDHESHVGREVDRSHDVRTKPAKTSAAATFALVFGLAALFCALTGILSPAAVVLGLIGLVLAIAGFKMTKRLGVTGKGLAIGGLVTSLLGLLLGAAVIAGAAAFVNDEANLDRIQGFVDDARAKLPSGSEVTDTVEQNTN
jgi:hypothetical protein